jgi:hypothetical protein
MAKKAKEIPHLRLRLGSSLLARLEKSREKTSRTMTGEIVARLEGSYQYAEQVADLQARGDELEARALELTREWDEKANKIRAEFDRRSAEDHREIDELERMLQAHVAASDMVNALLRNDTSSEVLRKIIAELMAQPEWNASPASRRTIADKVSAIIIGGDK